MPLDSAFSTSTLKRKKKHVFKQGVPTPVLKNAGVGIRQSNRCGLSHHSRVGIQTPSGKPEKESPDS